MGYRLHPIHPFEQIRSGKLTARSATLGSAANQLDLAAEASAASRLPHGSHHKLRMMTETAFLGMKCIKVLGKYQFAFDVSDVS